MMTSNKSNKQEKEQLELKTFGVKEGAGAKAVKSEPAPQQSEAAPSSTQSQDEQSIARRRERVEKKVFNNIKETGLVQNISKDEAAELAKTSGYAVLRESATYPGRIAKTSYDHDTGRVAHEILDFQNLGLRGSTNAKGVKDVLVNELNVAPNLDAYKTPKAQTASDTGEQTPESVKSDPSSKTSEAARGSTDSQEPEFKASKGDEWKDFYFDNIRKTGLVQNISKDEAAELAKKSGFTVLRESEKHPGRLAMTSWDGNKITDKIFDIKEDRNLNKTLKSFISKGLDRSKDAEAARNTLVSEYKVAPNLAAYKSSKPTMKASENSNKDDVKSAKTEVKTKAPPTGSGPQPKETAPQPKQTVPQPKQTVPQPKQTAPQQKQTAPQKKQTAPQKKGVEAQKKAKEQLKKDKKEAKKLVKDIEKEAKQFTKNLPILVRPFANILVKAVAKKIVQPGKPMQGNVAQRREMLRSGVDALQAYRSQSGGPGQNRKKDENQNPDGPKGPGR